MARRSYRATAVRARSDRAFPADAISGKEPLDFRSPAIWPFYMDLLTTAETIVSNNQTR